MRDEKRVASAGIYSSNLVKQDHTQKALFRSLVLVVDEESYRIRAKIVR